LVLISLPEQAIAQYESHYFEHGWVLVKLPRPEVIQDVRAVLQDELRRLSGVPNITLERYHEIADDDATHQNYQIQLTELFRKNRYVHHILSVQDELFRLFLGPDLLVQVHPYLRMARPGKPQDNIGYHRDTFYGASPYELSVWIPYVDLPAESSLSVLSGSHIRPESDFPVTQTQSAEVTKGSDLHKIGFPYAPKVMDADPLANIQAVPVKAGEALIFSLATVHGSVLNSGPIARWSTDIRVVNALAPVDLSARPDYYERMSSSVVSDRARAYEVAERNSRA
jgi:ectoine hydroxylase-related dioxygenase (phytanoyl-CoA dioxygenase family)